MNKGLRARIAALEGPTITIPTVVIVMKDCGSVARTNSCSRMAWERLTTAMTIL